MDISKLIKEAKHKSAAAQKCLFDLFADKLMLICMRYVKLREDAEEVLLDGFHKFFKSIDSFVYKTDAELYAFLKRIMINECLMLLRKKNVFTIVTEAEAENVMLNESALDNLSTKEIFELIIQLPVGYRTVFNLHVIEGMEHKEIAALMGISEGTSRSQLSKAKALLQKNLLQNGSESFKQKIK